jgi:hypothetical protein
MVSPGGLASKCAILATVTLWNSDHVLCNITVRLHHSEENWSEVGVLFINSIKRCKSVYLHTPRTPALGEFFRFSVGMQHSTGNMVAAIRCAKDTVLMGKAFVLANPRLLTRGQSS